MSMSAAVDAHVRLDAKIHGRMQRLASENARSLNAEINVAIKEYVSRHAAYHARHTPPAKRTVGR